MRGAYARILLVVVLLAPCVAALGQTDHWTRGDSTNYWNNDTNWEFGIPTTDMFATIRSDVELDVQEHVTIQTGNTGVGDWVRVGGPGLYEEEVLLPLPAAHLTIEAGANLYWGTGDISAHGELTVGNIYQGTVHNYGTADGLAQWYHPEDDPDGIAGGRILLNRIDVGYDTGSVPDAGEGYMFLYDGSYTRTGTLSLPRRSGCKGWVYIYSGATFNAAHGAHIAGFYSNMGGELNLLGGTMQVEDTYNAPEDKWEQASVLVGSPDALFTTGSSGVANLESGVMTVDGNYAMLNGTTNIGKDLEFTVGDHYYIRKANYQTPGYSPIFPEHPTAADLQTNVEIDIDPVSSVATNSQVVVGGNTEMDGGLYIENSGDRPKEGDQFTLWDGETGDGQTHDGSFIAVTTNLTGGSAGYSVAAVTGDWIATFTGLTGGDANGDHKVSIGDLSIMAGNWNQTGFSNGYADADFNGDGEVGIGDLSIMAGNWGWELPGGGVSVPEPATLSLLCLGGLALIRRRRS